MTLKDYCQIHGGSFLLSLFTENMTPDLVRKLESNSSDQKTALEIDHLFSSMSYDIIFDFMKFCSKTRVDATNVKTF